MVYLLLLKEWMGGNCTKKEGSEYIKYINRVDDELENGSDNPISNDVTSDVLWVIRRYK